LNHVAPEGVDALAAAGVVAVLLPASSLSSHLPFADGRRLVAAGVPVAVGTDFNANNWCESMPLVVALACHHNGLTPAEAVVAATINAAHAVGREGDVGSLEPGKQADVLILDLPSWHHLGYRLGGNAAEAVVKKGRVIVDHRPAS
jgi:imidazolonepropionase